MKTIDPVARQYPLRALAELNMHCPSSYESMLAKVPPNACIPGLYPWWFLPDPKETQQYAAAVAGRPVVPFAQAIGHDLLACFIVEEFASPSVIVINPWSERGAAQVRAILPNYSAWLTYAEETSARFLAQEREDSAE
jgi:hypothetical protein